MLLYYYDIFKHAPVFMPPIVPPVIPRKKNNYFLSTSHLVYPFQKSVVLYWCWLTFIYYQIKSEKKEKKYNAYGLTCTLTNERMISVIVVTVEKIGMNTTLEFNYFVIIILILFAFQRVFLFGLHTTFLITALSVVN